MIDAATGRTITNEDIKHLGVWDKYNNIKTLFEANCFGLHNVEPTHKRMLDLFIAQEYPYLDRSDEQRFTIKNILFDLAEQYDAVQLSSTQNTPSPKNPR